MTAGGLGRRVWAFPGGQIPFPSHGDEPELTGFDQLCVLNAGDDPADLAITVYYADQEPVGPYQITVAPRRVRHFRFNDLIDPEAIRLDRPFGCVVRSEVPVVVQMIRQDTRVPGAIALLGLLAYAEE
jgi:hypothetical protein